MKIEILKNGEVVDTKELGEGSWKVGRASECDLQLKSPQISKQHALLVIKGNKAAIVDLGSSNGVFVNGILVRKQRIEPGDDVQIVDFKIRIASGAGRRAAQPQPGGDAYEGAAAVNLDYQAEPNAMSEPVQALSPQEKFIAMMDEKVLMPYYELLKTCDWRWALSSILLIALVASVLLSVIPIVRWGKNITTKEALARAHTVIGQTVRENYRILSKTNDFTRLSVEACEAETGILSCYVVDPKTSSILAPTKLYNKSVVQTEMGASDEDSWVLLAMKKITEGKEEVVSVQKSDNVHVVAQPIFVYSPDSNDRQLTAIVLAMFEVPNSITSTFEPLVEAALFAVLLSLGAYFFIFKMITHPVHVMQEQLDAALKGDDVAIACPSKFGELENLAQQINFSISRMRQAGGGMAQAVTGEDNEGEDKAYITAVTLFDQATSDALVLLDKDNKVRFVGKALEDMIGMRNQYAQGQNISDACRDQSFAGTCIDLSGRVHSSLGETQNAQLDINGINRNMVAICHKNSGGDIRHVLVCVKLGAT